MGKFKNYDNACANPFLIHKKPITVGLRSFTSDMKGKFDTEIQLENEKYICTNCFNKISKLEPPKTIPETENSETSTSSSSSNSPLVEHTDNLAEEYSSLDDTNKTLQNFLISPLKSRK